MNDATESALREIEALLKGDTPPTVSSRRAFPRYSAAYPILLERDQRPFEPARGSTINLSRSGMLASVDGPIASGTVCRVTFLPRERYRPELIECPHCGSEFPILELPDEPIRGTAVRVERGEDGFVVAIMFATPLGTVDEGSDADSSG